MKKKRSHQRRFKNIEDENEKNAYEIINEGKISREDTVLETKLQSIVSS